VSADRCPMAPLVSAGRDGRLGEREAASLSRHRETCASCRDLERDLDEVRDLLRRPCAPPLTPLEHQRGRLALLRAAAEPLPPPRRSPLAAIAVAAAVVASLAGAAQVRPRPGPASVAQHLPARTLRLPRATVLGSGEARFARSAADKVERVALTEGILDLAVPKLAPDERFLVATEDSEVEVRGTSFEVEAHAGRIARVAVSEGKVEVRFGGTTSLVTAGGAWHPPAAGESPPPEGGPALAARAATAPILRDVRAATAPILRDAHAAASPTVSAAKPAPPDDASAAFSDAVDTIGRGDYADARARLDAFRAAHPADARADLATFLAVVSLQRQGRRSEAQDAARRYLELYPDGDRRAEALRVVQQR
jgi:ferric-dicitrate binding protein FerR (iron transport regulator)